MRKWLEENHVSKSRYFYWKRKLKDACLDQLSPSFVELPTPGTINDASSPNISDTFAVIRLGQVSIEIYENASAGFIKKLLEAAGHAQ